jgi:mediator of DNA damage checkpoint protein 1
MSVIIIHASKLNFVCFVQPLERLGRSIMKETKVPDDLLVISCEEDYQTCAPLLERGKSYLHCTSYTIFIEQSGQPANVHGYPLGASVFSSELVLNGIIIQMVDYER